MSPVLEKMAVGPGSAGILLSPEEFDALEDYDEGHRYELIHGVLVVSPIPSPAETGPNELLGYFLRHYQRSHKDGGALDDTLPQQYVRTATGRRIADRLIWTGLGRVPRPQKDVASIAVEFVSSGKRNRRRDYEDKRVEYRRAGIQEYWIFDRFERTLTVLRFQGKREKKLVLGEEEFYESPLLPGLQLSVREILEAADRGPEGDED